MLEKNTIDLIGKGIALAGFLFTAGTYAYNQHTAREEERYNKSVALIEDYRAAGIRDHEVALTTRLLYYNDPGQDLNDPASIDDEIFDSVAKETFFGFDGEVSAPESGLEAFLDEFLDITDFYARVNFCIDAEICDRPILTRYFCPRAATFHRRHRRLMAWYAAYSNTEDWNAGLESLVGICA